MTKKDWTLLVISSCNRKSLQPVHLQKSLFLLERNLTPSQLKVEDFYHFEPYDYGPFCSEIYSDAEKLVDEGYVHVDRPPKLSFQLYSPTEQGIAVANDLKKSLLPEASDYLKKIVQWACSLSFRSLISAIYNKYPDMKINAVGISQIIANEIKTGWNKDEYGKVAAEEAMDKIGEKISQKD